MDRVDEPSVSRGPSGMVTQGAATVPASVRQIPNALSVLRLLLALVLPVTPPELWLPVIVVGGGSDWLDGWVARRWRLESWAGELLDGAVQLSFGDPDVEALGFLHLEPLVDQSAQDLLLQATANLGRILETRRQDRKPRPHGQVQSRNDFVVDDGSGAQGVLCRSGQRRHDAGKDHDHCRVQNFQSAASPHDGGRSLSLPDDPMVDEIIWS